MKNRILILCLLLILSSCKTNDVHSKAQDMGEKTLPISHPIEKKIISIKEHAGLKEIFIRVFEANMKNLFVLLQGHHFISLALTGILEESVTLAKPNFSKWVKEKYPIRNTTTTMPVLSDVSVAPKILDASVGQNTTQPQVTPKETIPSTIIDSVTIAFFIGEQQFDTEIQELLNEHNIIPAFITSLVDEKVELYKNTKEFNAFMKDKYKITQEIKITSQDEGLKNKMVFYTYTLPKDELNKFSDFCNDLKLNFDDKTLELYCASKKNTAVAILCNQSFCPDSQP